MKVERVLPLHVFQLCRKIYYFAGYQKIVRHIGITTSSFKKSRVTVDPEEIFDLVIQ